MRRPTASARHGRRPGAPERITPLRAGLIVVAFSAIVTYAAFTKHNPLSHGFRFGAVYSSSLNVTPGTPVREAGIDVGKVVAMSRDGSPPAALITLEVNNDALPLHTDATLKIRPRLFLEGNFFIDLEPGSPSAPLLRPGMTVPLAQTSVAVQFDQVLDTFTADIRGDLQQIVTALGSALTSRPTAAEELAQEPAVRGRTAAQALNDTARHLTPALRGSAIVAQALAGRQPNDVSTLVASLGRATQALGHNENHLQGLIVNADLTMQTFAAESAALQSSVASLPGAVASTRAALVALNTALPSARRFAAALLPAVGEVPRLADTAQPWIASTRTLLSPGELGGLAAQLAATSPSLAQLVPGLTGLADQLDPLSRCLTRTLIPASEAQLGDGANTTGSPAYQELFHALVGINSLGASFDGNGTYLRPLLQAGGASFATGPIHIFGTSGASGSLDVLTSLPPQGTSPANPGVEPAIETTSPCDAQALPAFDGPAANGPADGPGR